VDQSDPAGAKFAWSGTGLTARFSGTSLAIRLDGGQQYTVLVDGALQPKLVSTGGWDPLATELAPGQHTIEVYRRTEANQGQSVFLGLDLGTGKLLPPPPAAEKRIEIIGDSITCGYGNEGENRDCGFTPDTENHYLTYGALAARELGAELHTVAWSGKGVVCNYGDAKDSCQDPLPSYYERTLPNSPASRWEFSTWQPQAVVVNLGTNDFSTDNDPTDAEFKTAYTAFLKRVRTVYPGAAILCTVGPMLSGADLETARSLIEQAVHALRASGDTKLTTFELSTTDPENGFGCDWHPSLKTHKIMASELTRVLRAELGW
jgi:lysophospholipase L1-like esterase